MQNDTTLEEAPLALNRAAPPVGTRFRQETAEITDTKYEARAPGAPVARFTTRTEKTGRQLVTVDSVGADAVTAVTVHFEELKNYEVTSRPTSSTPPTTRSHPVASNTYLVTAGAAGPTVARADGPALSPPEQGMLEFTFRRLGEPFLFARFLPEHVEPGDVVPVPADVAAELVTGNPHISTTNVSLVYRGKGEHDGETVAVFDLSLTLDGQTGPAQHMHTDLSGQVAIDPATCDRVWQSLAGALETTGEAPHKDTVMQITGSGTMESTATRTRITG